MPPKQQRPNMQQMLKQVQKMQQDMELAQQELAHETVEASAGGGMVTVKMNGQKQLTEVRVEPEIFKGKDQEMLQDLIQGAVNEATRRVDEELSKQVKELSGGMPGVAGLKIPGLF